MSALLRGALLRGALAACERLQRAQPTNAEFWRRLAGSIRKGLTLIE